MRCFFSPRRACCEQREVSRGGGAIVLAVFVRILTVVITVHNIAHPSARCDEEIRYGVTIVYSPADYSLFRRCELERSAPAGRPGSEKSNLGVVQGKCLHEHLLQSERGRAVVVNIRRPVVVWAFEGRKAVRCAV